MDAAAFAHRLLQPGTFLLDAARPDALSRHSLLFSRPVRVLEARTLEEVPVLLDALDGAAAEGLYAAGFLSYEAGYQAEQIAPVVPGPVPLAWFGFYEAPEVLPATAVDALLDRVGARPYRLSAPQFNLSLADYTGRIDRIRHHIREGDVYQINFTGALTFDFEGAPLGLYRALRRRQRVPYGAFLYTGGVHVLSCSPELFFRRNGDRVTTRPMKGTVRRGRTPAEDEALARWLAQDEKSRAENLMIVDLLRNDLSVCCRPGTVRVPALFTTEQYETLIQMTSTVEGRLREGVGYADLFRALFPCGSVTGAPKIRAMQLIHALEGRPRGVYCGTVGYVAPGAEALFNVAIRTVVLQGGRGEMGVGSGIVWDSDAQAEYEECVLKGRFLTGHAEAHTGGRPERQEAPDVALIETMRWDGALRLLDRHLARLRRSARALGFPFGEARLRAQLREATASLPPGRAYKVRLTLGPSGRIALSTAALEEQPCQTGRVLLSDRRVDTRDPFLYHKTTRRAFYEAAYDRARQAGFDEVLFLNERGEVTEGSRTNVFIRQGDAFYTPPVTSGLLRGVFREHLLETLPRVAERVLYPDDLQAADAVYLCNAVWGLVQVHFCPPLENLSGRQGPQSVIRDE